MTDSRSAYAILAEHYGVLATPRVLHELVRRLASDTNAVVHVWRSRSGGLGLELSWPLDHDDVPDLPHPAELNTAPGVSAGILIQDELHVYGAIALGPRPTRIVSDTERRLLMETADCLLLLWRRDELSTTVDRQNLHTLRLGGELVESGRKLSTVRELERRRVAVEMFTLSTARFVRLRQLVRHLDADVRAHRTPEASAVAQLRELLDELIEDFRTMVRGIHSQVLQDRGPRAALAEVVSGLSRATRVTGTIPARIDPELAATLSHLTTVAVQVLAAQDPGNRLARTFDPLEAHLSHTDVQLQVLIIARSGLSPAGLRAALTMDIDRFVALGGGVQIGAEDGVFRLRAWLPDRLEPAALPPVLAPTSLPVRVRELALGLAAQYGDDPVSARAWDLVTRLDRPVRLGVHVLAMEGAPSAVRREAWLTSLRLLLPDVDLGPYPSPTDPDDLPDAVLQASSEYPEEAADLLLPRAGVLLRSASWTDLPEMLNTELVARTDLLRARSVVDALTTLLREIPVTDLVGQRLRYKLEELQSGAHELAELEALAALRAGVLPLSPSQLRAAEQLLGSTGTTAADRLGLAASTGRNELIRVAEEQLLHWRRTGEMSAAGRRHRQVFSVIVRACEGVLAELTVTAANTSAESFPRPWSQRHAP